MTEGRRDKFVRLANKRVNTAIKAIELVSNLANRTNYEYTSEDATMIYKALEKELREMRSRFGPSDGAASSEFKLLP